MLNNSSIQANDKWSTYEANVQSYRSNMIASQSFLLSVGAILLDKSTCSLLICASIALIQLWFIWYRVIRVRTIIADFYKFNLSNRFSECGNPLTNGQCPLTEDTYLKKKHIRKIVNARLAQDEGKPKLKRNMRTTRFKLDLLLPISFTIIWISFIAPYSKDLISSLWEMLT